MALNSWRRWAASLALWVAWAGLAPLALAQQDLPGRVARVSQPDAAVEWAPAGGSDWQAIAPNWPLTTGDRIRLPDGVRTELHAGAHALRLQGPAQLEISVLDDNTARLTLSEGSLNLTVREMSGGERIEVGTGNLAMVVERPGEYRIDADPAGDTTLVGVRAGAATVFGESGESSPLAANTLARYVGRRLTAVSTQRLGPRDGLDQWAAERNRAEDQSLSAQHVSREVIGYQELDAHGEWGTDAALGTVWYPRIVSSDWAPYRYGQWRWVDPWGWTWIDDARWGFAPFHYGRWTQIGPRWAWVPGPRARRPAYAPALVGFAGTPLPRPPGFGRPHAPGTDWFPLAPGEAWRPPFGAGQRYLDQVNRGMQRPQPGQHPGYVHQRRPNAVSSSPQRDNRPDDLVRSTRRERPSSSGPDFGPAGPGPRFGAAGPEPRFGPAGPGPQFGPPDQGLPRRVEQERREREQRDANERQQWREQNGADQLQRRHEQNRQEQQQREWSAQQQQRQMRDQQEQQLRQQRQLQERQQNQMQDGQRQNERFMREQQEAQQRQQRGQQEAQQRQQRDLQEAQQRMQRDQRAAQEQLQRAQQPQQNLPPRSAIPERQRAPDGIRRSDRERN